MRSLHWISNNHSLDISCMPSSRVACRPGRTLDCTHGRSAAARLSGFATIRPCRRSACVRSSGLWHQVSWVTCSIGCESGERHLASCRALALLLHVLRRCTGRRLGGSRCALSLDQPAPSPVRRCGRLLQRQGRTLPCHLRCGGSNHRSRMY
jgi:hypothetical protein